MAEKEGGVEGGPSSASAEMGQERPKLRIVYNADFRHRQDLWQRAESIVKEGGIAFLRDDGCLVRHHPAIDKAEEDKRLMAQNAFSQERSAAPVTPSADAPASRLGSLLGFHKGRQPVPPPFEAPVTEALPVPPAPVAEPPQRPRVQWTKKKQRVASAARGVSSWLREFFVSVGVIWPLGFHIESLDQLKAIIGSRRASIVRNHWRRFSFRSGGWLLLKERVRKWSQAICDRVLLWRLSHVGSSFLPTMRKTLGPRVDRLTSLKWLKRDKRRSVDKKPEVLRRRSSKRGRASEKFSLGSPPVEVCARCKHDHEAVHGVIVLTEGDVYEGAH